MPDVEHEWTPQPGQKAQTTRRMSALSAPGGPLGAYVQVPSGTDLTVIGVYGKGQDRSVCYQIDGDPPGTERWTKLRWFRKDAKPTL